MENKDIDLTRKLIERDIETNGYIQRLWSKLSEEDKLIAEDILEYYIKKLHKKKLKFGRKDGYIDEEECNHRTFTKTLNKFFTEVYWGTTFYGTSYYTLTFKCTRNSLIKININITDFDIVNFTNVIIILLSKNLHKPHSEALQGTINEKV